MFVAKEHVLSVCVMMFVFFFFKQKTAYEMRISDWSSDVCSSDLAARVGDRRKHAMPGGFGFLLAREQPDFEAGFGRRGDEVGAVRRVADGGGGDALHLLHVHMLREQRVAAERDETACRILGRDAAVDREAAAEAGGDLFVEDHRDRKSQ